MKITSSIFLSIILLTILSVSFFRVNTTANTSKYETTSTHEYDPWIDYDDDGDIDLYDAVALLTRYGTKGTPISKTELLLDLLDRVDSLNASLLDLEAYLLTRINTLNASLVALESQILPPGFIRAPEYDSGWVSLTPASWLTLEHELGTTEVLVYMTGNTSLGDYGLNQAFYGGFFWNMTFNHGALWCKLNNNNISLIRYRGDYQWEQVRVRMWRIQEP